MRHFLLTLAIFAFGLIEPSAAQERRFSTGIAGSNAPDSHDRTRYYFDMPAVRQLLQRLESGPLNRQDIEEQLAGSNATVEDLLRTSVVAEHEGRFIIGFNYYTLEDIRLVRRIVAQHTPSLVAAYERERPALRRALDRYNVRSVDKDVLAYVLIAGIGLNWDGLRFTQEAGYRRPLLVTGSNFSYSFWATERDPEASTRGWIWGSSSAPLEFRNLTPPIDYSFTSYGDPDSYVVRRMNLPDLLFFSRDEMHPPIQTLADRIGYTDEDVLGIQLQQVIGFGVGRSLGEILFALRSGPKSTNTLAEHVRPEDQPRLGALLDLLEEIQYVRRDRRGRYELLIPVFDHQDLAMTEEVLAINRRVLNAWTAEHIPIMEREMSGITVLRQGLTFDAAFTQIWHEIFGLATYQLTQASYIADAYAADRRYPGSYGMVWRHAVYPGFRPS
ncbi:MAG: hypothetical protein AB7P07_06495 [Hyphomonadaceae bacterium]